MPKILIFYHSQEYGHTAAMARAVAEGARKSAAGGAEIEVVLHNANEGRYPAAEYRTFDGVAFGTPDYFSYFAGTLKTFLDDWYLAKKDDPAGLTGKPIALFLSHGGGGRARQPFEALFTRLGSPVAETVVSQGPPDTGALAACRELGAKLAQAVT
jgi:multimeric flavodoxin WrbA